MKIEKINENQIRFTLNKNDLASRELKLSELAYGSEKARSLFKDLMEQANYEYGFEADDLPLMIEAVPLSNDCIVLTVTRVEDPEELDTRFSKFAPSVHDDQPEGDLDSDFEDTPLDEVMDLFHKVQKADSGLFSDQNTTTNLPGAKSASKEAPAMQTKEKLPSDVVIVEYRVCEFNSLDHVIRFSRIVSTMNLCENSLYKDEKSGIWKLIIHNKIIEPEDFNKLCNIASEYGYILSHKPVPVSYYIKHCELICDQKAIQTMATI